MLVTQLDVLDHGATDVLAPACEWRDPLLKITQQAGTSHQGDAVTSVPCLIAL